jgi:hypothetical protein
MQIVVFSYVLQKNAGYLWEKIIFEASHWTAG